MIISFLGENRIIQNARNVKSKIPWEDRTKDIVHSLQLIIYFSSYNIDYYSLSIQVNRTYPIEWLTKDNSKKEILEVSLQ